MWEATRVLYHDEQKAARLSRKALERHPDCTDAHVVLAQIETRFVRDYVERMREAVAAGRRDLGPRCFEEGKGHFWGLIETRPFLRAMAMLADALIQWGTPEAMDEAIAIHEEMLELNPDDNQGVRDWLAGLYLARRRYNAAEVLLDRYSDDGLAASAWARVLLAHVTGGEQHAAPHLEEARRRNAHVEQYVTGRKRQPRNLAELYTPGDEDEAAWCAAKLWEAWKRHPKAKKWMKEACSPKA